MLGRCLSHKTGDEKLSYQTDQYRLQPVLPLLDRIHEILRQCLEVDARSLENIFLVELRRRHLHVCSIFRLWPIGGSLLGIAAVPLGVNNLREAFTVGPRFDYFPTPRKTRTPTIGVGSLKNQK